MLRACLTSILVFFLHKINTRRTIGQRRGGVAAKGNEVPPKAPVERVAMPIKPIEMTDAEVRESLH